MEKVKGDATGSVSHTYTIFEVEYQTRAKVKVSKNICRHSGGWLYNLVSLISLGIIPAIDYLCVVCRGLPWSYQLITLEDPLRRCRKTIRDKEVRRILESNVRSLLGDALGDALSLSLASRGIYACI